jgi:membrane protein YdbS with pleckstrin-like domain
MPTQFRCPGCHVLLSISGGTSGAIVTCSRCGVKMQVPQVSPPVALPVTGSHGPPPLPQKQTTVDPLLFDEPELLLAPTSQLSDQPFLPKSKNQEESLWTGRPSQIVNLVSFILCGLTCWLIIPLFVALKNWLTIKCTTYELTNQRFRTTRGVLSRRIDELELYRVKDTSLVQPFFLRLFSRANIVMTTSDASTPLVTIEAIQYEDAVRLRETIRLHVEELRDRKRVRQIDVI